MHPKHVWSYVIFPGSQGHIFPESHANKSCDVIVAERSLDKSCVRSCDGFPQSRVGSCEVPMVMCS